MKRLKLLAICGCLSRLIFNPCSYELTTLLNLKDGSEDVFLGFLW